MIDDVFGRKDSSDAAVQTIEFLPDPKHEEEPIKECYSETSTSYQYAEKIAPRNNAFWDPEWRMKAIIENEKPKEPEQNEP